MTAEQIALKQAASQRMQPLKAAPHVRGARQQVDLRRRADANHERPSVLSRRICQSSRTSAASNARGTSRRQSCPAST